MRLRDIHQLINEFAIKLDIGHEDIKNQPKIIKLTNIQQVIYALKRLETTGILKSKFDKIKVVEAFYLSPHETISFPRPQAEQLIQNIANLRQELMVIRTIIPEIIPTQNELSLSIKLPKIDDLDELSGIIKKLDKIFNQLLVNKYVEGQVKLQNFDTGSNWIEVLTNSLPALSVISFIIYMVIQLKREQIKNNELLEVARNRKITNDMLENISKQLSSNLDTLLENDIKSLMQRAGAPDTDKEYFERIKYCVNEMTGLIDKGLQFFPASKSPNEIKSIFPDFSKSGFDEMLPKLVEIPENASPEEDKE
jgi:hypothetical protein